MITRTVTLVATEDAIERYFPGTTLRNNPGLNPGIVSSKFPIDPTACKTALGRWLAENITTTRFDDDLSRVRIVIPATETGLQIKGLVKQLAESQKIENIEDAERVFTGIEKWLAERRKFIEVYGSHAFNYRLIDFLWPVFGSRAAGDAPTPEAYFDRAAQMMRLTDGVILSAGLGEALPDSLARTMANNDGLALLARYRKQLEVAGK